jgi:hypothetical protein
VDPAISLDHLLIPFFRYYRSVRLSLEEPLSHRGEMSVGPTISCPEKISRFPILLPRILPPTAREAAMVTTQTALFTRLLPTRRPTSPRTRPSPPLTTRRPLPHGEEPKGYGGGGEGRVAAAYGRRAFLFDILWMARIDEATTKQDVMGRIDDRGTLFFPVSDVSRLRKPTRDDDSDPSAMSTQ